MEPNERKSISFFRSYYEAACLITDQSDLADFYHAIFTYVFTGKEPEYITGTPMAMFKLVKPNLDNSLKKAEAGAVGGSKKKANSKQDLSKTEASDKQEESKPQAIKDKGYIELDKGVKEKINKKEKPPKHKHGKYNNVLLSDIEMEKLQAEFPLDWEQRIENVSEYCASHGKNYTDYLATIRNWARREKNKQPIGKNDAQAGFQKLLGLLGEEQTDEQS